MKLMNPAKDTHITHVLNQSNAFLQSLALAVASQKKAITSSSSSSSMTSPVDPSQYPSHSSSETIEMNKESMTLETSRLLKETNEDVQVGDREPLEDKDENQLDYNQAAHRIREPILSQSSISVGKKLKEYQVRGFEWMVSLYTHRWNGSLADEMGLGKTIQMISLITFLMGQKRHPGPFLIIVPLSTINNGSVEFEKWALPKNFEFLVAL